MLSPGGGRRGRVRNRAAKPKPHRGRETAPRNGNRTATAPQKSKPHAGQKPHRKNRIRSAESRNCTAKPKPGAGQMFTIIGPAKCETRPRGSFAGEKKANRNRIAKSKPHLKSETVRQHRNRAPQNLARASRNGNHTAKMGNRTAEHKPHHENRNRPAKPKPHHNTETAP